nr:glycosyltransferase family 4 protein [Mycobacterium sp. 852013-51886_SCH5428379]
MPTAVVHSGADLREFLALDRLNDTSRDEFRLLCVGRLMPWKGQDLLLDALHLISGHDGRLRVRIVGAEFGGAGELTANLRLKAETLGSHVSVDFVGESMTVADHYAWADAVVVPSKKPEPFGKVVIEGMAAGCTVIASAHGGPAEVIEDRRTGLLFEPGNAEALARAVTDLMLHPRLRSQLAANGRAASREWSGDVAAGSIMDFFERVISAKR